MLRQRLITSGFAGLCALAGILFLPAVALVGAALVAAFLVAREWALLAGLGTARAYVGYAAAVAALSLVPAGVLPPLVGFALPWLMAAVLAWLLVALWLMLGGRPASDQRGRRRWGWLMLGLGLLPALAGAFAWLVAAVEMGRGVVLYAVALVWAADSAAYFCGRALGRRRLAPAISSGKTWEGVAGGVAAVAVYGAVGGLLLGIEPTLLPVWIALAVVAGALSIVGDLLESVLKREAGVKDSGSILPGHGGLLDRVDSLMAALPTMALGLAWFPGVGT